MRLRDIAKTLFAGVTLAFAAGLTAAETLEEPATPANAPSECRKYGDVIDINLLRKRISETKRKTNIWIDQTYKFRFVYPSHIKPTRQFEPGTVEDGSWSWFSDKEKGRLLVALALPEMFQKTTVAEIRIGVSEDPVVVRDCRRLPKNATEDSLKTFRHRNTTYTVFTGRDEGVNSAISVQAYRTERDEKCYSIELMVYGPKTERNEKLNYATLKPDEAMNRLDHIWRQMDFQWLPDMVG